jgi:glutamyl-tRNA synthetase
VHPFALLSIMSRLGSSDPVELRTDMEALIDGFDIERFGSAPTKFDVEDLFPMTGRYLQTLPLEAVSDEIAALGVPDDKAALFWQVTRENVTTLRDLEGWWQMFSVGAEPVIADEDKEFVAEALALLPEGEFDESTWSTWTAAVKEQTGRKGKGLFMPLRLALTGKPHGPDMAAVLPLLQVVKARG